MQKYLLFSSWVFLVFWWCLLNKESIFENWKVSTSVLFMCPFIHSTHTHHHHCYIAYQVQLVMLKKSGAPEYTALTLSPPISHLVSALGQYNFPYDWLVQIVLCGLGSSVFGLCSFCFAVEHWMIHQWCDTCPSSRLAWNNLRRLCVT